ncbi:protein FAM171A2-like isoform X1 [Carassius carassius]|uniref:protein FAM171A2-like isoform X1 n=2 Tax=Carassius carassius TaxID=217509 RepID=UPI002868580C|nr:protein FAM171A2-like isoform X1 [Carassius carassius]
MRPTHTPRSFFLFLFLFSAWRTLAKSLQTPGPVEVLIKVQVFDNSDLSPLKESTVQVCGNQMVLASSLAGEDGIVTLAFLYRPGTWVIVTASKHGFVTNSAPWQASRIPLYASVSLYLLPQRPATLLLFDDVVQLLLGSPGSRKQPWVQLQRRTIRPPLNSSQVTLSAMLTSSRSQYELGGFPYPLALENNSTGTNSSWVELTALAAMCVQLTGPNGTEVQVSEPIHISIPLPFDSPLKAATSVPVWRFEVRTGLWVRSGAGYIKKEDTQMTWSFVAPNLGYWLAAFPSTSGTGLNTSGLRDITTYHTIFLLAILGAMALLVLILLCLLLYYCRRRCLKPRQHRRKMYPSSTLESSKRDQGTSTSHLNLISGGHMETASSAADHDGIKSDLSSNRDLHSSRDDFFTHGPTQRQHNSRINAYRKRGESFPLKTICSSNTGTLDLLLQDDCSKGYSSAEDSEERRYHHHNAKDNQGYSSDPPSPPPLLPLFTAHYPDHSRDSKPPEYYVAAGDHFSRPSSVNTQPGQLIFCHSMEQMKESMYHSMVPTLVIPAHYMHLPSDLSAVEQAMERQQQLQHEMEGIQVSMKLPWQQSQKQQQQQQQARQEKEESSSSQQAEGPSEENWGSEQSTAPVRIPVLFNDSTIAQMNGELHAITEKKLLEFGVKPHPRAWFVSLDGRSNSLVRHSYIELSNEALRAPVGPSKLAQDHRTEALPMSSGKSTHRKGKDEGRVKEGGERKAHGKIYSKLPIIETPESSSESHSAIYSPEENSTVPLLDETSESRGGTFPRKGRSRDNSTRSSTSEVHRDSVTSPDDDNEADDKDDDGENKKSPWQKREERPLMVFNVK